MLDEAELRERVEALPGMAATLGTLGEEPRCFLVGGAVRDLLLGREPSDVDIAVEGDAEAVAERLAVALGGAVTGHERFGTATVAAGGADAVNLARTRRERYAEPGALPEVEPAGLAEDLGRRDFTVNALALALNGDGAWRLADPHGGRDDLADGLVRVLHERSFADDPTRLLRAVRYAARLGFALEHDTERWAREAVAAGALDTVSGPRIRDELLDLLAEHEAPRAVELLGELGVDRALHPALHADPELVAAAKLGAAEMGADPVLAALAALAVARGAGLGEGGAGLGEGGGGEATDRADAAGVGAGASGATGVAATGAPRLAEWVDGLGVLAGERDRVVGAAGRAPLLVEELRRDLRPSELRRLLDGEPAEALALALALGAPAGPVLEYVSGLRGVTLEIDGDDLIAAGVAESPALGRALEETLARRLDGEVEGRGAELELALAIARGEIAKGER